MSYGQFSKKNLMCYFTPLGVKYFFSFTQRRKDAKFFLSHKNVRRDGSVRGDKPNL